MRKLVDGKLYDTDEAEEVARYRHGLQGDFSHYKEALYRTDAGRWFIAGKGNAKTKYANTTPDGMKGPGSDIRPLSDDDAFAWLERHDKIGAAQDHFPDHIEPA
jgi:hypothetical protein